MPASENKKEDPERYKSPPQSGSIGPASHPGAGIPGARRDLTVLPLEPGAVVKTSLVDDCAGPAPEPPALREAQACDRHSCWSQVPRSGAPPHLTLLSRAWTPRTRPSLHACSSDTGGGFTTTPRQPSAHTHPACQAAPMSVSSSLLSKSTSRSFPHPSSLTQAHHYPPVSAKDGAFSHQHEISAPSVLARESKSKLSTAQLSAKVCFQKRLS